MSRKPAGLDPGDTTVNRLSIRMILFIVVLSALHISAIAPLKPPPSDQSMPITPTAAPLTTLILPRLVHYACTAPLANGPDPNPCRAGKFRVTR